MNKDKVEVMVDLAEHERLVVRGMGMDLKTIGGDARPHEVREHWIQWIERNGETVHADLLVPSIVTYLRMMHRIEFDDEKQTWEPLNFTAVFSVDILEEGHVIHVHTSDTEYSYEWENNVELY